MKKELKTYLTKEIQEIVIGCLREEEKKTLDDIVDGVIKIVNKNKSFQIDIKD